MNATNTEIKVGGTYRHKLHGSCVVVRINREGCWIQVWGGINGGFPGCGFQLLNNTQGCWFLFGKSNHEGRMMLIEGGTNNIYWDFEQYGADAAGVTTLEITRPGAWPLEGRMNFVKATITDHPWGSGKHVRLGSGTSGNELDLRIVSDAPNIVDQGSGNTVQIRT